MEPHQLHLERLASVKVCIRRFSAFTGEEEFMLAPDTQLTVPAVRQERGGLCTVRPTEVEGARVVA